MRTDPLYLAAYQHHHNPRLGLSKIASSLSSSLPTHQSSSRKLLLPLLRQSTRRGRLLAHFQFYSTLSYSILFSHFCFTSFLLYGVDYFSRSNVYVRERKVTPLSARILSREGREAVYMHYIYKIAH